MHEFQIKLQYPSFFIIKPCLDSWEVEPQNVLHTKVQQGCRKEAIVDWFACRRLQSSSTLTVSPVPLHMIGRSFFLICSRWLGPSSQSTCIYIYMSARRSNWVVETRDRDCWLDCTQTHNCRVDKRSARSILLPGLGGSIRCFWAVLPSHRIYHTTLSHCFPYGCGGKEKTSAEGVNCFAETFTRGMRECRASACPKSWPWLVHSDCHTQGFSVICLLPKMNTQKLNSFWRCAISC